MALKFSGGAIPRWPIANVYTGCMCGAHADEMILDGFVKGLPNVNYTVSFSRILLIPYSDCCPLRQLAYQGMYAMATSENNPHINLGALTQYIQYGLVV